MTARLTAASASKPAANSEAISRIRSESAARSSAGSSPSQRRSSSSKVRSSSSATRGIYGRGLAFGTCRGSRCTSATSRPTARPTRSSTRRTRACSAAAASTGRSTARPGPSCSPSAGRSAAARRATREITGARAPGGAGTSIHAVGPVWRGGGARRGRAARVLLPARDRARGRARGAHGRAPRRSRRAPTATRSSRRRDVAIAATAAALAAHPGVEEARFWLFDERAHAAFGAALTRSG